MTKAPSPLVGFNNNVKHLGRIFHVQTEDSGVSRPHIVTHLFADGGRIIKSTRTDYAEHVGSASMSTVVRRLMKEQHKAMFIALRDGQLDVAIEQVLGSPGDAAPAGTAPDPAAAPPSRRRSKPPPTLPDTALSAINAPSLGPPPRIDDEEALAPEPRRPAPTLTDLVLKDLEAAQTRAPRKPEGEKPAARGGTPILGTPVASPERGPVLGRSPSGRYAAARPAAIFSPGQGGASLFGGSSISEQSLDEVILSYLAEDLEGSPEE